MPQVQNVVQGQAETTDYRVSSKVPARVFELRVNEGDFVHRGDTLVRLEAPDVNAKLSQAEAAYAAANAQEEKQKNGTRTEQVQQAYEMWQKAKAGLDVAKKSFGRISRLYEEGVMTEQKRDEARANYDAMVASERAAHAQYDMAVNGSRREDKEAAKAQRERAQGAVREVASYVSETVLCATSDGYVTEVFPEVGELVGTGAPIMNISCTNDVWFTFNIREDMLKHIQIGAQAKVYIPSLDKHVVVRITRMKDVGSFAVWKATRSLDGVDLKTFEVRARPLHVDEVKGLLSGLSVVMETK